jgi:hypothetical protein
VTREWRRPGSSNEGVMDGVAQQHTVERLTVWTSAGTTTRRRSTASRSTCGATRRASRSPRPFARRPRAHTRRHAPDHGSTWAVPRSWPSSFRHRRTTCWRRAFRSTSCRATQMRAARRWGACGTPRSRAGRGCRPRPTACTSSR